MRSQKNIQKRIAVSGSKELNDVNCVARRNYTRAAPHYERQGKMKYVGKRWECDSCGGAHTFSWGYTRCGLLWYLSLALGSAKRLYRYERAARAHYGRRFWLREAGRTLVHGNGQ